MSRRGTKIGRGTLGILVILMALQAHPVVAEVRPERIAMDRCVSEGRPPGDCRWVEMELRETEERELRRLIALARARETREEQAAKREGKVTGGVWGFVSFSYRVTWSDGHSQRHAWLHVSNDAAWLDGDELRVVFNTVESRQVAKVLARVHPKKIAEGERESAVDPLDIVRRLPVEIQWRIAATADLNCDLVNDHVFAASDSSSYYVAVVVSPLNEKSIATSVRFALHGDSQDALCGTDPSLEAESLDTDLLELLGAEPEGWHRSRFCSGIRLQSGDCDSFHLYWSLDQAKLDWWRL